jgi:hypothetical protein
MEQGAYAWGGSDSCAEQSSRGLTSRVKEAAIVSLCLTVGVTVQLPLMLFVRAFGARKKVGGSSAHRLDYNTGHSLPPLIVYLDNGHDRHDLMGHSNRPCAAGSDYTHADDRYPYEVYAYATR